MKGSWKFFKSREHIIARQAREIQLLKQKVHFLMRRLFGTKSEKIDEAQLRLLLEDGLPPESPGKDPASSDGDAPGEAAEVGAKAKAKRRRGGHRSHITGLDKLEVDLTDTCRAIGPMPPPTSEGASRNAYDGPPYRADLPNRGRPAGEEGGTRPAREREGVAERSLGSAHRQNAAGAAAQTPARRRCRPKNARRLAA